MSVEPRPTLAHLSTLLHRRLLPLIVASYALAAVLPGPGLWAKGLRPLTVHGAGPRLPALLLGFLLFSAGLRARPGRLLATFRRPALMLVGLAANLVVPLAYVLTAYLALQAWHNPKEVGTVLVGLALVASMPIAGSSTGWARHADGDMELSLGLVVASTLLSPLTTPLALRVVGLASPDGFAGDLQRLAGRDTGSFLLLWVLVPSLLGMAVRQALGDRRGAALESRLKSAGALVLLALCYVNASACLPLALGAPDWDFLALTVAVVGGLCLLTFGAGYLVARACRADRGQRVALMFGLGMNNNGTGLVLASAVLAATPAVLLPIIAYNLAQHLVAAGVHAWAGATDAT